MASPLPEPFQLIDILGDGEILTCRAELRGEEVLVHVLPADPAGRDRVFARIARLPRSSYFLDRIEHQGHSLVVTRSVPELEDFEGWLDELAPEPGAEPAPPEPPKGEATRLVLNIRAHVEEKAAKPPEPRRTPDPGDRPTPPMTPGLLGVPDAWSSADDPDAETGERPAPDLPPEPRSQEEITTGGHRPMTDPPSVLDGDAPTGGHRAMTDPPSVVDGDAPTGGHPAARPGPADPPPTPHPPTPERRSPTPAERPTAPPEVSSDAPTREPRPAPPVGRPGDGPSDAGKPRRKTQLFLSMVPPGGLESDASDASASAGPPSSPPEPPSPPARSEAPARPDPKSAPAPPPARSALSGIEPVHLFAAGAVLVAVLAVVYVLVLR